MWCGKCDRARAFCKCEIRCDCAAWQRSLGSTLCHSPTHAERAKVLVMDIRTAQALVRFGLGRRGAEPLPADPTAWLLDQLRQPDPTRLDDPPTTAAGLAALREDRATKPPPGRIAEPRAVQGSGRRATGERDDHPAPFRERLVWFWTNHFTISLQRGAVRRGRRRLRGGSHPPACHRPLRRHGAGGHAPSGHAALSRQRPVGSARTAWSASAPIAA